AKIHSPYIVHPRAHCQPSSPTRPPAVTRRCQRSHVGYNRYEPPRLTGAGSSRSFRHRAEESLTVSSFDV
ncbi:hypothetical protein PanWU01x14_152650, partial [Parasponia andersonii]